MGMKRKIIRRTLLTYLDCYLSGSQHEQGKIIDISEKGMLLISGIKMDLEKNYSFRISLPRNNTLSAKIIKVDSLCRWVRPAEINGFYYYGFIFTKTERNHRNIINKLIDNIGFSDGKKTNSILNSGFDFM